MNRHVFSWRWSEMLMRLAEIIYAPFYALFFVGATAMLVEMWLDSRKVISSVRL